MLQVVTCDYLKVGVPSTRICCLYQTGEEEEAWETVTAEREQWVRLIHHLEALTILSNTIGVDAMRRLPSVPFIVSEESDKAAEILDIGVLEVHLLQNGNSLTCSYICCQDL